MQKYKYDHTLRDYLIKAEIILPKEFVELKKKYHLEVESELHKVWDNRKRIVMNFRICAEWFPENWKDMNEQQLYQHFHKYFCLENRIIQSFETDTEGNTRLTKKGEFEQIASSKIFEDKLIGNYAKDFNEMTRRGIRKDMSGEFYRIWARSILKMLIKPEFFILGTVYVNFLIRTFFANWKLRLK